MPLSWNILILSNFQRIYYLSCSYDFVLHLGHTTQTFEFLCIYSRPPYWYFIKHGMLLLLFLLPRFLYLLQYFPKPYWYSCCQPVFQSCNPVESVELMATFTLFSFLRYRFSVSWLWGTHCLWTFLDLCNCQIVSTIMDNPCERSDISYCGIRLFVSLPISRGFCKCFDLGTLCSSLLLHQYWHVICHSQLI